MARMPEIAGVGHRYVDAGGLRMHVAEAGEGEPLLMLHGWPQHWYMWRGVMPPLAERYRVIAPDLRGHGWTDAPAGGYDKERMADDVVRLMDELELDRVRLAGHDWGGWIGWILCMRHPERFERYLALNIPPPWPVANASTLATAWRFWYQVVIGMPGFGPWLLRSRPEFTRAFIKSGALDRKAWTGSELAAFSEPLAKPAVARASSLLYRTFLLRELGPVASGRYRPYRLSTPTLLLFGVHDKAISTRLIAGYEPYADDFEVEFVEESGHWIAEEVPDLVVDRALGFFAGGA